MRFTEGAIMFDDFVQQTVELLKYSDIGIESPCIESIECYPNGTSMFTSSSYSFSAPAQMRDNVVLNVIILFSLLDALVDRRLPHLEGISLIKRYQGLPSDNDHQTIFKELYRIMRVFRNAIVHSKSGLSKTNDDFIIDYYYKGSHFTLTIKVRSLQLVFSMIIHYVHRGDSPYITGILRNYYDEMNRGVIAFSDDVNAPRANIREGLRLKNLRYRIKDRPYQIDESANIFSVSRYELRHTEKRWASLDYYLSVDGQTYLIPDEALNSSSAITVTDMEEWMYDKDRFF
jgi:hypothetical protein